MGNATTISGGGAVGIWAGFAAQSGQQAWTMPALGWPRCKPRAWRRSGPGCSFAALMASILLLFMGVNVLRADPADVSSIVREFFAKARRTYTSQPTNTQAAWQFGRACFDLALIATNHAEQAEVAEQGIAACRKAVEAEPGSAAAHYYLALNLGQLASTRGFSALKLVSQMETELKAAITADEKFDSAGPHRALGLLYAEAPSVISVGSRSKARQHLQRAVELAPGFPDNRLTLVDVYLKWGDRVGAARELKALEATLPEARRKFAGPAWAADWADWDPRLEKARKKLEGPARLESPRH